MKIRYYLRGLGLGILVTAVFFLLGDNSGQTMSDEMIKERAKELGMVESTVLADMNTDVEETSIEETVYDLESVAVELSSEAEETTEEAVVEETVTEEELTGEEESTTIQEEESTTIQEEETQEIQSVEEASEEETSEATAPTGQLISIIVNKGEGSDTVSHRLHEAGLVDDPYEYDKYLMQNGYDKRIGAGEHMIPTGASWQEIAKILCS